MKDSWKRAAAVGVGIVGLYASLRAVAKLGSEKKDINQDNPYLGGDWGYSEAVGHGHAGAYERRVKPMLDGVLSFGGLVILSPLFLVISLAILVDDPGPVLFAQKRVGKDRRLFMLHKFRTMKMSTPHDVPTHQLEHPEQYITRVGAFLRKTSLDELPQVWDIFRGKMSIIGPRPALWNQEDLVAEREKYGANGVLPGLTGWAQINGRDELEIPDKARLDGEYVRHLRQGGVRALFFDCRCFLGTILSVLESDGVVEGGTGAMEATDCGGDGSSYARNDVLEAGKGLKGEVPRVRGEHAEIRVPHEASRRDDEPTAYRNAETVRAENKSNGGNAEPEKVETVSAAEAGFEEYGHLKHFHIDTGEDNKKRVLITGAGSYIGESFERWAREHYPVNFTVDTVDMQNPGWRAKDFSSYDTVFHVAGIAHADVGKVSEEEKRKYYAVNTDLAIETAEKAKVEGVRQFILMSSMIIYGDSAPFGKEKVIDERTVPAPANFYGDSKWQADKGVRGLADEVFRVAVLRPPMIYGKGSKGNYPVLARLAKILPVFPDVENRRSMLYIDNLCEFLCKLMLSGEGGVYFPQNGEYARTSEMVRLIAETARKKMWVTKLLNPAVMIGSHVPGKVSRLVDKAFGNAIYSQKLSRFEGLDYHKNGLIESIRRTEGEERFNVTNNFSAFNQESIEKASVDHMQKACDSRRTETDNRLHILVISQYFYPEIFRINDIASEWVKRGYKVTVLTGIPNYPTGKFFDGYGYRNRRKECWNGIDIIRIPLIPRGSNSNKLFNSLGLVANYLSFVLSGWWWKNVTKVKADLVFTFEVSPMTQALIGCWYGKKLHIPNYIYITDLWPENVEFVTGIHSKMLITPIQHMVDYIYKNVDYILTCSKGFIEPIRSRGIDPSKIEYWPQYAENFYKPEKREGGLLPQKGVLNLVFAGNVGYAQGLEILIEAAKRLKKEGVPVLFDIIGDGRYLDGLKKDIRQAEVDEYFHFVPRQPAEKIPKYLAYADAVLIILSKSEVFARTIPAKTQSCMACGRPILASADGEVQDIIRKSGAGICCDAGDLDGFVESIKQLLRLSSEEREQFGANALLYSQRHFDKEILLSRLDEIFYGTSEIDKVNREGISGNVSI